MTKVLTGRNIVVTGAGAGIGLGILRQVVAAGANVTGFDISKDAEARVLAEGAHYKHVDVTDLDAFETSLNAVRAEQGPLDGLVNNAGVTINVPFLEMTRAQMETIWTLNQRSVLAGCQAAARIMIADGTKGSLVNIGSVHTRCSNPGMEAYAASKGAISAMARAMAWSLGPHGIRVNSLCPGLTLTEPVFEAAKNPTRDQYFRSWHATGDLNTVDDIGNIAVFLLSDLSAAITGSDILADRGISALLGMRDDRTL